MENRRLRREGARKNMGAKVEMEPWRQRPKVEEDMEPNSTQSAYFVTDNFSP